MKKTRALNEVVGNSCYTIFQCVQNMSTHRFMYAEKSELTMQTRTTISDCQLLL